MHDANAYLRVEYWLNDKEMESPQTDPFDKLTDKQKVFVLAYCRCFNGAKAAREAGYSEDIARQIAHENMTKPYISAAISEKMEEWGMSAGESIGRMTRFARATMESFLTDDGQLTLTSKEAMADRGLLKKVRQKRIIRTTLANGTVETVEEIQTEFEMYDAMAAVDKMLQVHGRYKMKIDLSNMTDAQVEELLNKAMSKLE